MKTTPPWCARPLPLGPAECYRRRPLPAVRTLFSVTALLGAALLFLVEPMFARMVLPLLGGAPAVWNTCLVFYQVALLGGYFLLLAWRLRRDGGRRDAVVLFHYSLAYLALLFVAAAVDPVVL